MPKALDGRVVCLTGAGRGIGREAALLFANNGAITHVSDANGTAAESTVDEIRSSGGDAFAHICDVANENSVAELFESIRGAHGKLDALVNNAGVYPKLDFYETTLAEFDRIVAINFRGVFLCTMASLALFEAAGRGSIICMSSSSASLQSLTAPMTSAGSLPIYGATKAAVDRWALSVAKDLCSRNIAMNILYPSVVILTDGIRALDLTDAEVAVTAPPAALAPAIVWLAQQDATFTGQLLRSDEFEKSWGPSTTDRTE